MKDKSWIIILIMGIALTISIGYSIKVSKESKNREEMVTTTSIIEMKATTVTIKNTLTGTGKIENKEQENNNENLENKINNENTQQEILKKYQITLSIEDKDLEKVKEDQEVEISIKKEDENLSYTGRVSQINQNTNNKSTLNIEILNFDDKIEENAQANCTVIIEKAENVVGLPIEAIQKNDEDEEVVNVVQNDGTTIPTKIKTGISDAYYVEITSGLKVGDRVQIIKSTTTVVDEKNNSKNNEK